MQNDFLSSLSSRAIHETRAETAPGGLVPRLASLFEPALSVPGLPALEQAPAMLEQQLETEAPRPAAPPASTHPAQPPETLSHPSAPPVSPTPTRAERSHSPARAERAPSATTSAEQPAQPDPAPLIFERVTVEHHYGEIPPASPPPATLQARVADSPREANPDSPQPRPLPPASVDRTPLSGLEQALESLRRQVQKDGPPAARLESSPAAEPAPSRAEHSETGLVPQQIVITQRDQPPLPAGVQPGLVPVTTLPERGSQNRLSQSETQPASIHVTIGRIEVRATNAQPSAPKRSAPAPANMSLDEYLRRRSGGNQ